MPDLLYNHEASINETRGLKNLSPFQFDRNITRAPEHIITIFTVNTLPQFSASGKVGFVGRPKNKRFIKVGNISDPSYDFDALSVEGQPGRNIVNNEDGEWKAMDWLNPENIYKLDQDYIVPGLPDYSTDLLQRGVFYIKRKYDSKSGNIDDQPTEAEVVAAEKRLGKRRDALVLLYHQTKTSNPARLAGIMSEEMVEALNAKGVVSEFNPGQDKAPCERCGDLKLPAMKYHMSQSLGTICIEPSTEGWRAAVNGGVKNKADVPDEFQWDGRRKI